MSATLISGSPSPPLPTSIAQPVFPPVVKFFVFDQTDTASAAALRCLGILPRDPIPESTEEDATRPDEGMTEEQVREAYRRMVVS